ncbi:MAG: glycosyltransferase family 2 protein, partial [Bacteroidota bacterium]
MPAVSVIMPVYNAESFLQEAIESILTQSFRDFEFLIFNDGSTDNSKQIIQSISDPRIKLFDSDINQGYVSLLNKGIDLAHGKYIARMDADDIAHPHRLQKQFDKLEQHPDHVICGTRFTTVGSNQVTALPLEDDDIKLKMLYITPFCHPSVMIRAAVLKDHQLRYEHDYMPAEDYQLWVTLSDYGKFCNLSESLMHYRVHHNNISMKERS